jgi:hypothetical protein
MDLKEMEMEDVDFIHLICCRIKLWIEVYGSNYLYKYVNKEF